MSDRAGHLGRSFVGFLAAVLEYCMYTPLLPQGFVRRKDQRILADEDALRSVRLTFARRRLASPQMTGRYQPLGDAT
jgi:hypothetical protein